MRSGSATSTTFEEYSAADSIDCLTLPTQTNTYPFVLPPLYPIPSQFRVRTNNIVSKWVTFIFYVIIDDVLTKIMDVFLAYPFFLRTSISTEIVTPHIHRHVWYLYLHNKSESSHLFKIPNSLSFSHTRMISLEEICGSIIVMHPCHTIIWNSKFRSETCFNISVEI